MDMQPKEPVAPVADEDLKTFVRSSPEALETGALERVAGAGRSVLVPIG